MHPRSIPDGADGVFDLDLLEDLVRPLHDAHQPRSALIAVENTHNNCGGKVLPLEYLKQVRIQGKLSKHDSDQNLEPSQLHDVLM